MFYFTFTFYKNDSCFYNIITETNTQPQTKANERKRTQTTANESKRTQTNANNSKRTQTTANERNEQQNHRK